MLFGPKGICSLQKVTDALAQTGSLPNSGQRVRGKCCSGKRVRAICKKSQTLWPQLQVSQMQAKGYEENVVQAKGYVQFAKSHELFGPNCTFLKLKPKGKRKILFAKGYVQLAKSHVTFVHNCGNGRLPNSSQSSRVFFFWFKPKSPR